MNKEQVLQRVLAKIRKEHGNDAALLLSEGGQRAEVKEVIPTGLDVLDNWVLGCGGLPIGRISEVFGPEGSGKTALALAALAACQRDGGVGLYCETEFAFNEERATVMGVDVDELLLLQPDNMEGAVDMMTGALETLPASGPPVLVVWDSVAATPPEAERKGEASDVVMGVRARLLNKFTRVLPKLLVDKRSHAMLINQVREKIGVQFGNPEVTPGGPSIKFASSIRLRLSSAKAEKVDGDANYKDIPIKNVKNKVAIPHRETTCRLSFDQGWDNDWTTVNFGKDRKIVNNDARVTPDNVKKVLDEMRWQHALEVVGSAQVPE